MSDTYQMLVDRESGVCLIDPGQRKITRFIAYSDGETVLAGTKDREYGGILEYHRLVFVEIP